MTSQAPETDEQREARLQTAQVLGSQTRSSETMELQKVGLDTTRQ